MFKNSGRSFLLAILFATLSTTGWAQDAKTVLTKVNHKVVGYINGNNLVERVQTTTDDGVAVEGIYRDYADFRGLKAPTTLIRNRGGMLVQVVIVKDAKVTGI